MTASTLRSRPSKSRAVGWTLCTSRDPITRRLRASSFEKTPPHKRRRISPIFASACAPAVSPTSTSSTSSTFRGRRSTTASMTPRSSLRRRTIGLEDVAAGELDAFLCQVHRGSAGIAEGLALRAIVPPAYVAYPAGALDRSSTLSMAAFAERVDTSLRPSRRTAPSPRYRRGTSTTTYASAAADFDLTTLDQVID